MSLEECRYCYGTGLDGAASWGWGCPLCLGAGKTAPEINAIYNKYYKQRHKKDTGCDGWSMSQTLEEIHALGKNVRDYLGAQ